MSTPRKPRIPEITGPDGTTVRLDSLPLVAYSLKCSHVGRDYAVMLNDLVFCETCRSDQRVTRILAD